MTATSYDSGTVVVLTDPTGIAVILQAFDPSTGASDYSGVTLNRSRSSTAARPLRGGRNTRAVVTRGSHDKEPGLLKRRWTKAESAPQYA